MRNMNTKPSHSSNSNVMKAKVPSICLPYIEKKVKATSINSYMP